MQRRDFQPVDSMHSVAQKKMNPLQKLTAKCQKMFTKRKSTQKATKRSVFLACSPIQDEQLEVSVDELVFISLQ